MNDHSHMPIDLDCPFVGEENDDREIAALHAVDCSDYCQNTWPEEDDDARECLGVERFDDEEEMTLADLDQIEGD